jgi:hypothetical protein
VALRQLAAECVGAGAQRYGDQQLRYHYVKDARALLEEVVAGEEEVVAGEERG